MRHSIIQEFSYDLKYTVKTTAKDKCKKNSIKIFEKGVSKPLKP